MREKHTKLIIEDNTIYEIDLECMQRKEEQRKRESAKPYGNTKAMDPYYKKNKRPGI